MSNVMVAQTGERREVKRAWERNGTRPAMWWCPFCDTSHQDTFDTCRKCGAYREKAAPPPGMGSVTVTCSRCGSAVQGIRLAGGTAGFYDVTVEPWRRYARPDETIVCDACMWADPAYQADFPTVTAAIQEEGATAQHVNAAGETTSAELFGKTDPDPLAPPPGAAGAVAALDPLQCADCPPDKPFVGKTPHSLATHRRMKHQPEVQA